MARPLLLPLGMMNTTLAPDTDLQSETTATRGSRKASQDYLLHLYDSYHTLVHRICFRYTKNRDEAEDLAQEVFLKVHANYASFEGNAQPSTWLYRVTVNHCLDHLRWRKRQGELMSAFADEMAERRPQESAVDHPAKRLFRKLLEDLDEGNRQVVMLRFEVGLTHEEIAEICGVSRVAITKRLAKFQAKVQSLKTELGDYLEGAGEMACARQTSEAGEEG
jgi:RNA polymerase sigma-70 factor (ECF subfamily)